MSLLRFLHCPELIWRSCSTETQSAVELVRFSSSLMPEADTSLREMIDASFRQKSRSDFRCDKIKLGQSACMLDSATARAILWI